MNDDFVKELAEKRGMSMAMWTTDELDKIGRAEELQIASLRSDTAS